MSKKILIVGGVAGGASAAARLRRLDEQAEIIMFERGEHISFANCGLPYYIGGVITEREKLLVQTPEAFNERFNIDVRIHSDVTHVDPNRKVVKVNSRKAGVYEEHYDYLILSPGAKPIKPGIPGIEHERILTLRNLPDTDAIKTMTDGKKIKEAVVIGGGFIGVEMAENLVKRCIQVHLVEAASHVLAPFDADMVMMVEKEMQRNGIELTLGDGVAAFRENGKQVEVELAGGTRKHGDLVLLAIGVSPDTAFIKDSGIALGPKGHIIVNERMETNYRDIYAVGDAVEVKDFVTGLKTAIPLAGPANKQGRIAADNIAGLSSIYKGTQGTSILKVFELTAACTGGNEKTLQSADIAYRVCHIHPASHASYYPGAVPMALKLLFSEQGKILGAQAIGYEGVDKRIDVIAAAIRLYGTVDDLAELELSYAPPFSSAKDPVNMAGYVAQNILSGKSNVITWNDMEDLNKEDYILVDVRSSEEFENGNIEGAVNIPVDSLRERIGELDKNKTIVEYCQVGLRGYLADRILSQKGYDVYNISGGYKSALSEMNPEDGASSNGRLSQEPSPNIIDQDAHTLKEINERANPVNTKSTIIPDKSIDACGLCCPGPLLQVKSAMDELKEGEVLKVSASDPGFYEDIQAWCRRTDNQLLDVSSHMGIITALIQKGVTGEKEICQINASTRNKKNKTMVVFSGDLDRAIASFIIANGAAAMGKKVTMFFTFWGLNILRKPEKVTTEKGFVDKMFALMMPRGTRRLKLSNMNMLGLGGRMIRQVMKNKRVSSLEDLMHSAVESGIEIVACQMSMDVMGLKQEELIDGVKIGGVGYYLSEAEDADMNLFI
ncbi:MAG: CoA-disulfide reductase [Desulfobacterales bacterium]